MLSPPQTAAPDGDGTGQVASAPPAEDSVYALRGAPGPWRQAGASREDFDRDARICIDASNEARANAAPGEGSPAAYAAFLDCMTERRWTRGA